MQKIRPLKIADNVNIYPQPFNRYHCDKNHQSGEVRLWGIQIISQVGGMNPRLWICSEFGSDDHFYLTGISPMR